ncbi:MAG TPA: DinB family protein [Gemmatimonadaceae bacterium]
MVRLGNRHVAFAAALAASASLLPLSQARAQEVLDAKSATHVFKAYENDLDTLHAKFLALATAIPADKYSWRPAPGVRSISEAFLHVASEFYYWGPMSIGGTMPADWKSAKDHIPAIEKITGKDQVIAELNKSWAHYQSQLKAAEPSKLTGAYKPWGEPLDVAAFSMVDDLHEHLGQMIAYSRSVGVKPPWSK